jgi:NAD(P)-dependent dehydrogenase (short-subunit alcohol dehydrogenase family)
VQLSGKVALVTGGAAGIGRATAVRLAAERAKVVVADVDDAAGRALAVELEGSFVRTDVSVDEDVRAMIDHAQRAHGGLDVLVNNAGGVGSPNYPDAPLTRWSHVLDVNLRAVMLATQLALEPMAERGGGAIVNVASVAGLGLGAYGAPEYAAAKAGVVRLTASLAGLAPERGVRVNCICPDWVDTPAVRRSLEKLPPEKQAVRTLVPAEEIADAIVQLVRDDSLAGRVVVRRRDEDGRRLLPVEGE